MNTSVKKYSFFVFLFLIIFGLVIIIPTFSNKNYVNLNLTNQKSEITSVSPTYRSDKVDIQTDLSKHPDFKNGTLFLLPGQNDFTTIKIKNISELKNVNVSIKNSNIVKVSSINENTLEIIGLKLGETELIFNADNANDLKISVSVGKVIPSNILGETEGIVATTNGVYNYKYEKIGNNNFDNLTKDDLWGISNYFIVTKYGIYTTWNTPIAKQYWGQLKKDDFIWANGYFLVLKQGIFNTENQQVNNEYWNENSSKKDILASSTSVLVLNNYVITYGPGEPLQINKLARKITFDDIYGLSDSMVATTVGVFSYKNNVFNISLNDLRRDEFIGISLNFLVTTRGVFYSDGNNYVMDYESHYLNHLKHDQVIAVTNNFLITTEMIFPLNRTDYLSINLTKDDYIDSSTHWIVTKKGIYHFSHKIEKINTSDEIKNIKQSDLLCITDSIVMTKQYAYLSLDDGYIAKPISLNSKDDIYSWSCNRVFTSNGIMTLSGWLTTFPDFLKIKKEEIIQTPKDDGIYWPLDKNTGFDEQKIKFNSEKIAGSAVFVTNGGMFFSNDQITDFVLTPTFSNSNPNWDNESYLIPTTINNSGLSAGVLTAIIVSSVVFSISLLGLCIWISHRKNQKMNTITHKKIDRLEKSTILVFNKLNDNLQNKKQPPKLITKHTNFKFKNKQAVPKAVFSTDLKNLKIKKPVIISNTKNLNDDKKRISN
ncbi:hypothetical protein [Mycoplasmoides pirum]|uniref:hypothetical protein n=1 Tax=Mycoplasmoides pirum TaxID=2122 RepID=UPI000485D2CE|nr:hypothetical protein [Mycoplasmoides pirum]